MILFKLITGSWSETRRSKEHWSGRQLLTAMAECPFHGYCTLGMVMVYSVLCVSANEGNLQEICMSENFQAECPDRHVVLMLSALYGRMHVGRCARQGNIGCVADALIYLDIRCSGRQRCDFVTPDENLLGLKPCPTDYPPYLEAIYSCIPVISDPVLLSECQDNGFIVLSGVTDGYIASSIIQNARQGTRLCPWIIEAEQGQQINVTMLDFRTHSTEATGATCDIYATLTERTSPSPTMICSGADRERIVYLSSSSRVEIHFMDVIEAGVDSRFLLKFAVNGCQDPPLNGNVLKQRTINSAVLHCKATGTDQDIHCRGTFWDARVEQCTESDWGIFSKDWGSQQGFWIVLAIGIAIGIALGLGLLVCGIMCFQRYKKHRGSHRNESPYDANVSRQSDNFIYAKKGYDSPYGDMNYATYDRKAGTSQKQYMHAMDPVNRDVMLIESTGTLKYHSTTSKAKGPIAIQYMDAEEPAYEKPR